MLDVSTSQRWLTTYNAAAVVGGSSNMQLVLNQNGAQVYGLMKFGATSE